MRKLTMLVASTAMAIGFAAVATPAQAVTYNCNFNGVVVCTPVPGALPKYFTATSLNASPEPAKYAGVGAPATAPSVNVSGKVLTLTGAGSTLSRTGTARLYFVRNGVTTTPVYMGTATVGSTGAFSKAITQRWSGTWFALYSGNSRMISNRSNNDYVQVTKVFKLASTKTVVTESSGRALTTYDTPYRAMNPAQSLKVVASFRCSSPVGSVTISTRDSSGENDSRTVAHSSGTVFTDTVYLDVAEFATAVRAQSGNHPCSVSLIGTQQTPADIRTVL